MYEIYYTTIYVTNDTYYISSQEKKAHYNVITQIYP